MTENTADIIKVGVNKVNALTGELYQDNKIIHDMSNDNRKQNYFAICDTNTFWLHKMCSRHGQNEHQQITAMPLVESKDNIDESIGTIEMEIEIFY